MYRPSGAVGGSEQLLEKSLRRDRRLATPPFDRVDRFGGGQAVDGRPQVCELIVGQGVLVESCPVAQGELQQELGAQVAQVLDGSVEPVAPSPTPGRGRCEDGAPAGFGPGRQTFGDEPIDRSIREWTAQRPDPAELAIACEQFDDRPAVGGLFADDREAGVIGE